MKNSRTLAHIATACAFFALGMFTQSVRPCAQERQITDTLFITHALEPIPADTLSDWQILQMAIMMTESRFNPNATGKTEDRGVLQLTPIYVREANRIAGTNYIPEDAYDPLKSIHMFSVVQDHHNPERDGNKAIKLHNPGGASIGYPAKVKSNLEFIKRYEAARTVIKDYELRKGI